MRSPESPPQTQTVPVTLSHILISLNWPTHSAPIKYLIFTACYSQANRVILRAPWIKLVGNEHTKLSLLLWVMATEET